MVDDGSTDATPAVLAELAARHAWVRPLAREGGNGEHIAAGRRQARDLIGFRVGVNALARPADVVDEGGRRHRLRARLLRAPVARFEADETLGIASGTCYEREGGSVGAPP